MSLALNDPKCFANIRPSWVATLLVICSLCLSTAATAQEPAKPYRKLAPGVMKEVDSHKQAEETVSRHDIVELLAVDPTFDWAKNIAFRRDVWYLDIRFKPLRLVEVDIPHSSGNMRKTQVWYLIYSVTNKGKSMHPVKDEGKKYKIVDADLPIKFAPQFLLEATEFDKRYPERVIPLAMGPIRKREDPNRKFLNSVEMTREIAVNETVWGVATWESIDPRIDRFSIYVHGLTNAYRWQDRPNGFKKGNPIGTGRRLARKALKLNFWRPGDEYDRREEDIRYGIPGEVDYEWIYR